MLVLLHHYISYNGKEVLKLYSLCTDPLSCNYPTIWGCSTYQLPKLAISVESAKMSFIYTTFTYRALSLPNDNRVRAVWRKNERILTPEAKRTKPRFTAGDEENSGQRVVLLCAPWPPVVIYSTRERVSAIYEWGDSMVRESAPVTLAITEITAGRSADPNQQARRRAWAI